MTLMTAEEIKVKMTAEEAKRITDSVRIDNVEEELVECLYKVKDAAYEGHYKAEHIVLDTVDCAELEKRLEGLGYSADSEYLDSERRVVIIEWRGLI